MVVVSRLFSTIVFVAGILFVAPAQDFQLTQSNASGIYKRGEKIKVTVNLDGVESDSVSVKVLKNYTQTVREEKMLKPAGELVVYEGVQEGPASMIFEVRAGEMKADLGAVIAPERMVPGTKRPKSIDDFWELEKMALRKLDMDVKYEKVDAEEDYVCSDVEINCTGPRPARGYFAKPENAQKRSLPIVLYVHAAGVKGDWCLSKPETALHYAQMGKGALAFDLNAHGMLNGKPQEYYNIMEENELKNYWEIGMENRQENYFRGMYLRLIRTIEFLTRQPEWDRERIIVIGESQGGGQALAAAGLDERVTAVVATVPAMCDFGAELAGSKGGWPNPFSYEGDKEQMIRTLPYFDTAHLLKGSKATIVAEIGFVDYVCPSNSIYAAINQAKGEKIVLGVPYRAHQLYQKSYQNEWEENVYRVRMDFIKEFLR